MPFNNPGRDNFPTGLPFENHRSLNTKIPIDPKPAADLPVYSSPQHLQALGFYSTEDCPKGKAVIFANGKAFTNVWKPTDKAAKAKKITGPEDVVPLARFEDRERALRRDYPLRRVVILHQRLTQADLLGLCITNNLDQREAVLMYALATQVYRRQCHRCATNKNVFGHCSVMPDIDCPYHQEEKCAGCHYVGEHCVFDDKIRDQSPGELSQEDLVQVVTSPYLQDRLEGLASSWRGVANNATFRAGVASVTDYNFRRQLQNFQVNLFGALNTLHQINVAPMSILEIRTLPNIPLHNSLAAEPEREGDDWPPTTIQAQLERAARTNKIANQPFHLPDPRPESPAPSSVGSRSRLGSGLVSPTSQTGSGRRSGRGSGVVSPRTGGGLPRSGSGNLGSRGGRGGGTG